jgi:hypothetical protein
LGGNMYSYGYSATSGLAPGTHLVSNLWELHQRTYLLKLTTFQDLPSYSYFITINIKPFRQHVPVGS